MNQEDNILYRFKWRKATINGLRDFHEIVQFRLHNFKNSVLDCYITAKSTYQSAIIFVGTQ